MPHPALEQPKRNHPAAVGPVRVDAAAYASVVVTTLFAYLAWVGGVVAPPDVIAGTIATVAGAVGIIVPNRS